MSCRLYFVVKKSHFTNKMSDLLYVFSVLFTISISVCSKPNIILILTDDQDILLGGMIPMVKTINFIANSGTTFQNAFVNAPICCPSRSSILTGRFPHNTDVQNNSVSGGCASQTWRQNLEPYSIASLLQNSYKTFYAGKYLNQYGSKESGDKNNVPKGWESWYGLVGNSKYYNFTLVENGVRKHYRKSYLTDVISEKAVKFLKDNLKQKSKPLFMVVAPPAPHAPFTPAPRHQGFYPSMKALKTPAFNYTPDGKHWLLNMPPLYLPKNISRLDKIQQHRFEALLAVDDLVEAIINELQDFNELNNSYIIFTSDNGYHIGQFCQPFDKRQPYDTDIRVPLLIRGPGLRPKTINPFPIQSVDLSPTILQMANLPIPDYMDGRGVLGNILGEVKDPWNRNILLEYHGEGNAKSNDKNCPWSQDNNLAECGLESWCKCQDSINNTYNCIRQINSDVQDFLFCRFSDSQDFAEAYDLHSDRYQLNNIYKQMKTQDVHMFDKLLQKMLNCQGKNCRNL